MCKIGNKCVVDPSYEEECCSVISLVVGVTGNPVCYSASTKNVDNIRLPDGKCTSISMNGPGSLHSKTLKTAIDQGVWVCKCWA